MDQLSRVAPYPSQISSPRRRGAFNAGARGSVLRSDEDFGSSLTVYDLYQGRPMTEELANRIHEQVANSDLINPRGGVSGWVRLSPNLLGRDGSADGLRLLSHHVRDLQVRLGKQEPAPRSP